MLRLGISSYMLLLTRVIYAGVKLEHPAEFTSPVSDLTFYLPINRNFSLNCSANGLPMPTITWTLNSQPVPPSTNVTSDVTQKEIVSVLYVESFTAASEGTYRCSAETVFPANDGVQEYKTVQLSYAMYVLQSKIDEWTRTKRAEYVVQFGKYARYPCPSAPKTQGPVWFVWYRKKKVGSTFKDEPLNLQTEENCQHFLIDAQGTLHIAWSRNITEIQTYVCGLQNKYMVVKKPITVLKAEGVKNVALQKNTSQSSTGVESSVTGASSKAVDGDKSTDFTHCAYTTNETITPYWSVDLNELFTIKYVNIVNRDDAMGEYLSGLNIQVLINDPQDPDKQIAVGACIEVSIKIPLGATKKLECVKPLVGQFVKVSHANRYLSICELEVMGLPFAENWSSKYPKEIKYYTGKNRSQDLTFETGSTAQLACLVNGANQDGQFTITWTDEDGSEIQNETDRYLILQCGVILQISSVIERDQQDYKCSVVIETETLTATMSLKIVSKPIWLLPLEEIAPKAGGKGVLECVARSALGSKPADEPGEPVWFMNGALMEDYNRSKFLFSDKNRSLTVIDLRPSDTACFQCFVKNSVGESFSAGCINVGGIPREKEETDIEDDAKEKKKEEERKKEEKFFSWSSTSFRVFVGFCVSLSFMIFFALTVFVMRKIDISKDEEGSSLGENKKGNGSGIKSKSIQSLSNVSISGSNVDDKPVTKAEDTTEDEIDVAKAKSGKKDQAKAKGVKKVSKKEDVPAKKVETVKAKGTDKKEEEKEKTADTVDDAPGEKEEKTTEKEEKATEKEEKATEKEEKATDKDTEEKEEDEDPQ